MFKHALSILLLLAVAGLAASSSATDYDFTITVLATHHPTYCQQVLGLEYDEDYDELMFVSDINNMIYACNPNNATYLGHWDVHGSNGSGWGVCLDDTTNILANDTANSSMWEFDGSNWSNFTNPCGSNGRGMDGNSYYTWAVDRSGGDHEIRRFLDDGTAIMNFNADEPSSDLTGLTVFPHDSELWIMVTTESNSKFWIYEFDEPHNELDFIAEINTPSCSTSLGLAYAPSRDSFFWSYTYSSSYYITELDIDISQSNIEETTWGQLKAAHSLAN